MSAALSSVDQTAIVLAEPGTNPRDSGKLPGRNIVLLLASGGLWLGIWRLVAMLIQ